MDRDHDKDDLAIKHLSRELPLDLDKVYISDTSEIVLK